MILNKNIYLHLLLIFTLISCDNRPTSIIKAESNFKKYIYDTFPQHKIDNEKFYYLINSTSCEPCLLHSISVLIDLPKNPKIIPILSGIGPNIEIKTFFKSIVNDYPIALVDENLRFLNYNIDYSKPIVLHFKNEKLVKIIYISDFNPLEGSEYIAACLNNN